MPPVLGPLSSSKMALWSCEVGRGRIVSPSVKTRERGLFPLKKFLHHDPLPGGAEFLLDHDPLQSRERLLDGLAENHPFSGRQAVGFDDQGRSFSLNVPDAAA